MQALVVNGACAIWRHEMRGGYGYGERIPVVIVRQRQKRVRIRAMRKSGEIVERLVEPASLFTPTGGEWPIHAAIFALLQQQTRTCEACDGFGSEVLDGGVAVRCGFCNGTGNVKA